MMKKLKIGWYPQRQVFKRSAFVVLFLFFFSFHHSQITIVEGAMVYGDSLVISNNGISVTYLDDYNSHVEKTKATTNGNQLKSSINKNQKVLKKAISKTIKKNGKPFDKPEQLFNSGSSSDYTFGFAKQNYLVFIVPQNFHFLKIGLLSEKHFIFYNNVSEKSKITFSSCNNRNYILFINASSRAPPSA